MSKNFWRDIPSRSAMQARVDAYFTPSEVNVNKHAFETAFTKVQKMFTDHYGSNQKICGIREALSNLPSDTSAGFPFVSGTRKGDVRCELKSLATNCWNRVTTKGDFLAVPCIAGARNSIRPINENKPRLVFAYPGFINVIESQFLRPFMADVPPFTGWAYNWTDGGRSYDRLKCRVDRCRSWCNIDFSGFDASVGSWLIRNAFSIIKDCLDLDHNQTLMLNHLIEYFIHTPLAIYGHIIQKHRGIPSGSAFTGLVGTIVNMLACAYASEVSDYYNLIAPLCVWLGDDSCLFLDEGMTFDVFVVDFLNRFGDLGLKVNWVKTRYTISLCRNIQIGFLGRTFLAKSRSYGIDYEKLDAQVMLPETKDKSRFDTASRLIGLVWAYGQDYSAYAQLESAYNKLRIGNKLVKPRKSVRAFVERFVGEDVILTSFPSFDRIVSRYFGTLLQPIPLKQRWIRTKQWE